MPPVQDHGRVVGMPHAASDVDPGVAAHNPPVPPTPLRLRKISIFGFRQALLRARSDIHRLPSDSKELFANMRLAAAASKERFAVQDHHLRYIHLGVRHKEPFALADARAIPTSISAFRPNISLTVHDEFGFQGLNCVFDAAHL